MELKEGMICVVKGGNWSSSINSLKDSIFYIVQLGISVVTLSRYTHTFTIIKEKNKWMIVDATHKYGVCMRELYEPWLQNSIISNNIDVFEQEKFNKKEFMRKLKEEIGGKYYYLGILNIGIFNIVGKYVPFKSKKNFFCSELTSYLHNIQINKEFYLNAPVDVALCNELKRVV